MFKQLKKNLLLSLCFLIPFSAHSWPFKGDSNKNNTSKGFNLPKININLETSLTPDAVIKGLIITLQIGAGIWAIGSYAHLSYTVNKLCFQLWKLGLQKNSYKKAKGYISRLSIAMFMNSPEVVPLEHLVKTILSLPWKKETTDNLNISHIKEILDQSNYGMETTKKRILTFMATKILNKSSKPPILCLVGEPGLGKTTLAQSIANALGRKQCKISFGGLSSIAALRGSTRQSRDAKPGDVIEELNRVQSKNPVFVLDEVDKIGHKTDEGDPSAALLEILDPEQNKEFKDLYLDIPFDLSNCFFIATANYIDDIPAALRDRMEFIYLERYSTQDKLEIAKQFLVPKMLKETGLNDKGIIISDEVLLLLIEGYTQEAGVRNLQRIIKQVFSQVAYHYLNAHELLHLTPEVITFILGKRDNDRIGTLGQKLATKVKNLHLDRQQEKEILDKIDQLSHMPSASVDHSILRNYIELFVSLPWGKETANITDLQNIKSILDEDHYGFEAIKEQILNFIATQTLTKDNHAPILCFVGAPGIGKTSLAQSIAKALGRKSAKIALGGVSDPHELRGFIRSLPGAKPGTIIEGLRRAGSSNPVFVLDEIDKIGRQSHQGDPTAALLEILDPIQNEQFRDHYVDEPFDLSKIFFIATANSLEDIPAPLVNRMEIVHLSGYSEKEKVHIARNHLIPKIIKTTGLEGKCELLTDALIQLIIEDYTLEAGVRSLEREIKKLYSGAARFFVEHGTALSFTPETIRKYLGPKRKGLNDGIILQSKVGITNELGYTQVGGSVLKVEALLMPGTGKLQLTGKLGDVMQESAKAAVSYVRAHAQELGIDSKKFKDYDLHIHFPAGAMPKDGPSAGMALITSIVSACTNRPVNGLYAMTGEINLQGQVTGIGGVKEKVLAAKKVGVTHVFVPFDNKEDIEEIDAELLEGITILYAKQAEDVLKVILLPTL